MNEWRHADHIHTPRAKTLSFLGQILNPKTSSFGTEGVHSNQHYVVFYLRLPIYVVLTFQYILQI